MQERWGWTSCRIQASFHAPSVAMEWAATASSAMPASTGCTRNAMGSSAWHWLQMYTVPGNCMPLGWQPIEGSPGQTWQAGGGSFLLLPRRHTLSSRWLWTFNHNTSENPWNKFKKLLPVLSSCHLSFKTCGYVYSPCVWSAMLHASETWPLTKPNIQCLQRNNRAMIWQICNVRLQDTVTTRSNALLARLCIKYLDLILKERRLHWYGHVEHSSGAAFHIQVEGKCGLRKPKMTWKQLS